MNCQEISRIMDTGAFRHLDEARRRAAEAHAGSCRHCAPEWGAHSRVAGMRVSPMPPDLIARCQVLAESPVRPGTRPSLRKFTLVGSLIALVAAAAALTVWLEAERGDAVASTPMAVAQEAAVVLPETDHEPESGRAPEPVVGDASAEPAISGKVVMATPALPLIPMPARPDRRAMMELALLKAVERHPELVEGPAMDGATAVALAMRADGSVVSSIAKPTTPENYQHVNAELERTLPADSGGSSLSVHRKDTALPDGRFLRTDVSLRFVLIGNTYDMARSELRARQILGDKYAQYMRPAAGNDHYRLTVLLSVDGTIVREKLENMTLARQAGQPAVRRTYRADDPGDVADMARGIAERLEIDPGHIGLLGLTALEAGSMAVVVDESGNIRPEDRRNTLFVEYAWQRRDGESGPRWGQGPAESPETSVNLDNALVVVEREIPDAFVRRDRAAGTPVVVLTARGELIRAGWVRQDGGGHTEKLLQDQLVPRVQVGYFSSVRLTDGSGTTIDVMFAWERPGTEPDAPAQP